MQIIDWRQRIVELVFVKQKLHEADQKKLWEYRLPGVAATEEQLVAAEKAIGESLDPQYRDFLSYAGGWPAFMQEIDLLGPQDFLGGERFIHGMQLLSYIEEIALSSAGVRRQDLLPIGVSSHDIDLFLMTRQSSSDPGHVIWFAGQEIDRFRNFDEFFASMVEYNRKEIERAKANQ